MIQIARKRRQGDKPRAVLIDPQLLDILDDMSRSLGITVQGSTNIALCLGLGRRDLIPEEFRQDREAQA